MASITPDRRQEIADALAADAKAIASGKASDSRTPGQKAEVSQLLTDIREGRASISTGGEIVYFSPEPNP